MPKKIEIDSEKLKTLHAQGLTDGMIGERLGCSKATIGLKRRQLGLPGGKRGRRPGVGGHEAAQTANPSADGHKRRQSADAAATATVHLSAAALDRLWAALSLETKGELIEGIAD